MIQDIKFIIKIINLINVKLRTPKINSLYRMIDFLKMKEIEIEKLSLDSIPLNNILNFRSFNKNYDQFIINTSNKKSNQILINYLNIFPLLSSKYLDFKD